MRERMWEATVVAQLVRCQLYQGWWWKGHWQERETEVVLREIAPRPNLLGNFPGTGRRPKFAPAK